MEEVDVTMAAQVSAYLRFIAFLVGLANAHFRDLVMGSIKLHIDIYSQFKRFGKTVGST